MGSIEHSIQVFNWMKNQKNYCARNDIYNMMIRLHARHNRIDQARGLFFEMQKWRYGCFIKCVDDRIFSYNSHFQDFSPFGFTVSWIIKGAVPLIKQCKMLNVTLIL